MKTSGKRAIYMAGWGLSRRPASDVHLSLDVQPPELWEINLCCLRRPSLAFCCRARAGWDGPEPWSVPRELESSPEEPTLGNTLGSVFHSSSPLSHSIVLLLPSCFPRKPASLRPHCQQLHPGLSPDPPGLRTPLSASILQVLPEGTFET